MVVLSDKSLRERIARNELVLDGRPSGAEHCSYEFTAAKILRGGTSKVIEVTEPGVTIAPAQLVWIRTCERIAMPPDMVGFWIQTNTLSREGLLLLNMSLVEPGYEGYLTAVFVNFGQREVPIGPTTKIAKVVFVPLDAEAIEKVDSGQFEAYDRRLLGYAANAPRSFLQLESFIPNLEEKADAKLVAIDNELKRRSEAIQQEVRQRMDAMATQAKENIEKDLRDDVMGLAKRWGGGILAGFAVGCIAVWFAVSSLLPQMVASYSKVDELVQKAIKTQHVDTLDELARRVQVQAAEIQTLRKQFSLLEAKHDSLRSRNGQGEAPSQFRSPKTTKEND